MNRKIHFEMDTSDLNLSQSIIGNTSASTAARLMPRPFDVSLMTVGGSTNSDNYASNVTSARNKTSTSVSMLDVSAKINSDHALNNKQREEEIRIRNELEQSKVLLIEQYQLNEARINAELAGIHESYAKQIQEKESIWQQKEADQQEKIQKLEQKLTDVLEMFRKRLADKDRASLEQLEKQEETWKLRIEDLKEEHLEIVQSIHDKYSLEKDSHLLAEKARLAAKEDQVRNAYEVKIKKYESQVHDVMRNYHDKELIIHGSLEEARNEIIRMRTSSAEKEDVLRAELTAKDRIILNLQSKLHLIDDITKVADSWRSASRDLARIVVKACVSIQDMPHLPSPPKENSPNLLMGYGKEDAEVVQQKQAYAAQVKAFYRLRKENVIVQRELISRALRNSKKIIERVQAETIPAADFKINGEDEDDSEE